MPVKTSLEAEVGGSGFGSQSDYKVGEGGGDRLYATNNCISVRTCTKKIFMRDGIRERKTRAMKHETNLNFCFPLPHRHVWLNYGRLDHTV